MDISVALAGDIDVALNESTLVGLEVRAKDRLVGVTLAVLALPDGPGTFEDPRIVLVLGPVGRVVATMRVRDDAAEVWQLAGPIGVSDLEWVVDGFGQQDLSGWNFLDVPDEAGYNGWASPPCMDWRPGTEFAHTIDLYQESPDGRRRLDVRCWFDEMRVVQASDGSNLALEEFAERGVRWWEAFHAGDPRTADAGLHASDHG